MTDERNVEDLYQRALDLPPKERDAFVGREARHDSALERRVRWLLDHFEQAPDDYLQGACWRRNKGSAAGDPG